MNIKNLNMTLGVLASLTLIACSGSNNGGGATIDQASSGILPTKSSSIFTPYTGGSSSSSSSIPKSYQSSGGNVISNTNGVQNINSNGGDCSGMVITGESSQITILNGQTISNVVSKKSAASAFVECESIESGEKITLDGQKVCMSAEACIGKLSSYEAVRAVDSPCRDAIILNDAQVASMLAK